LNGGRKDRLSIAGGCLALFVTGAGAFSMDAKTGGRWF